MLTPLFSFSQRKLLLLVLLVVSSAGVSFAQTTTISYAGRLTDSSSGAPLNGTYDFRFTLYDGAGAQRATVVHEDVSVKDGLFTVRLDFTAQEFSGEDLTLEIGVRPGTSTGQFTVLSPRQPITSTPYAIRSLVATRADGAIDAMQLGGVPASNYVLTTDPRLSGERPPAPGSPNYIQNTTAPQTGANFNISGDGIAGGTLSATAVNAATQYNIGGNRVLSVEGTDNTFVGVNAGASPTSNRKAPLRINAGQRNTFTGANAGASNTGIDNSFFGASAGRSNTTGSSNAFFGSQAGSANGEGSYNSFFGYNAGNANTTGIFNAFFGAGAGGDNTTGRDNVFIGNVAGNANTEGSSNVFLGSNAGTVNRYGSNITLIGTSANVGADNLTNATAIGFEAEVTLSDSLVLGKVGTKVGIGTPAPQDRLHVNGIIRVDTLGNVGATTLCRNSSGQLSFCSSSLRYKANVQPFAGGMDIVDRLRPITFTWKQSGTRDIGLGAEDVAAIEPLLITHNDKGEVEGVKYDHLNVVLINAIKQQQAQIEQQQTQIKQQQQQIESLKKIVCLDHPNAEICK